MTYIKLNKDNLTDSMRTTVTKSKDYVTTAIELWDSKFTSFSRSIDSELTTLYRNYRDTFNGLKSNGNVMRKNGKPGGSLSDDEKECLSKHGHNTSEFFPSSNANFDTTESAKNGFISLLTSCKNHNDPNAAYSKLDEIRIKFENILKGLDNIWSRIVEFENEYSHIKDAEAEALGLSVTKSENGDILSFNTTVTIDGEKVEIRTSEAMNAFFTYSNTVMNAEVTAEFFNQYNGIEINYTEIVNNANSFMAETIRSGLYSTEFIRGILPEYNNITADQAKTTVGNMLGGFILSDIQSVLNNNKDILGNLSLFPALVGATFLGNVVSSGNPVTGANGQYPYGEQYPSLGGNKGGNNADEDDEPYWWEDLEDNKSNSSGLTTIVLESVTTTEVPAEVKVEEPIEANYDELAKDEYDFNTPKGEIDEYRVELLSKIDELWNSNDLDTFRSILKGYGYQDVDIELILQDKNILIKAIFEGDERSMLAAKALELAKADGIENYDTIYDDAPRYTDLIKNEGPSELLTLASEDESIVALKATADAAKLEYSKAVEETNIVLAEVTKAKEAMTEIQNKYTTKYGENLSKWTPEAITEYNTYIKSYNDTTEKAAAYLENLEKSKTAYSDAYTKFSDAKKEYYEKLKADYTTTTEENNTGSNNETIPSPSISPIPTLNENGEWVLDYGTGNIEESDDETANNNGITYGDNTFELS